MSLSEPEDPHQANREYRQTGLPGMWTVFANPFSTQLFGKTDWWHTVLAIVAVSLAVVPILYLIGTRTARSAELPAEARIADVV